MSIAVYPLKQNFNLFVSSVDFYQFKHRIRNFAHENWTNLESQLLTLSNQTCPVCKTCFNRSHTVAILSDVMISLIRSYIAKSCWKCDSQCSPHQPFWDICAVSWPKTLFSRCHSFSGYNLGLADFEQNTIRNKYSSVVKVVEFYIKAGEFQ